MCFISFTNTLQFITVSYCWASSARCRSAWTFNSSSSLMSLLCLLIFFDISLNSLSLYSFKFSSAMISSSLWSWSWFSSRFLRFSSVFRSDWLSIFVMIQSSLTLSSSLFLSVLSVSVSVTSVSVSITHLINCWNDCCTLIAQSCTMSEWTYLWLSTILLHWTTTLKICMIQCIEERESVYKHFSVICKYLKQNQSVLSWLNKINDVRMITYSVSDNDHDQI